MQSEMTIGRLAACAGVNLETIRYYQRRGLIDEPRKPYRGHRTYSAAALTRLRFIKRAQAMGFTLDEIAELLRPDVENCCAHAKALAVRKLAMIEQKLADLAAIRDRLAVLVDRCESEKFAVPCPILDVLERDA